ncbi:hypothetical protein HPB52_000314 [Rhipicephalus sanguineus]|uniref:Peptidase M13 C-terminal domain-containing protein n=1 Tax=Rhipicephalus sanguineus TaxID=34632 RepID=A0A9D4PFK8_RHISA|nr:hypothetical protein HPB52_000314 [Rhipicephalus sanguineus]
MSHCADISPDERDAPYSARPEEGSPLQDPRCTTVQTRSRAQIMVARTPSRLPYFAVCSVGLLMVAVGVAVTTYKLHAGDAIMALFNSSMELLRRGVNGSAGGGSGLDNVMSGANPTYLAKHERKVLVSQSTCSSDVCVWAENYLRGRLNSTVNPCTDFYAHVCSRHWEAVDLEMQSRAYRERAAGMMMADIERFFRDYLKENEERYHNKLAPIINETDTVTLLNYIGYRLVVHLSPLLARAASPLLRLSHDDYLEFVPDRRQACMHLLERLYKHGMRFFGRMTFSKTNSTLLLKHYDYSLSGLEVQLKSSMTDRLLSSSSWLDRSAIGIGVDKIENMRLVVLGSTDDINTIASYYNFNASPLDPSHLIGSFRELQASTMNTYWETKPPKDDLDARYDHTALSPGHEYFFGRNVLFIPHANIAFLNDISKSVEPVLFPLVLAEIFRGMFGAVDRRGATVDHNLAVATWWNSDEMSKFSQLELCFQDQYYVEIRDLIGDNFEARLRLEENIADNAIIGPLHDMYMKVLMSQDGADRLKISVDDRQLDMEQLFFVLYAVGLCDNTNREAWMRTLKFGDIPGRLRVNIPLMNFAKFSSAFSCTSGMPMNPVRKCTIW